MSHWGDTVDLVVTSVASDGDHSVIEGEDTSEWDEMTVPTVCTDATSDACSV